MLKGQLVDCESRGGLPFGTRGVPLGVPSPKRLSHSPSLGVPRARRPTRSAQPEAPTHPERPTHLERLTRNVELCVPFWE